MTTRQQNLEQSLYDDGFRCGSKGLGLTARGIYNYSAWTRLMQRAWAWGKLAGQERLDDTFEDAWRQGIQDGYDKRRYLTSNTGFTAEASAQGWC